ncbi:MAG: ubiquinone/menaquinone biosynthesis methyltransferase [Acidobacteria bacterium]|jgi:demethylmenaquinone methyltransferase/2-methoxy-6-polyprenyl-1,4-benzoquinol methylase|nr:ubiquinone/menaquinone biosynthesis methyltransferase [Acidobacteriota bacterium]
MNKVIKEFYTRIWQSYELINSILTLGMDARWRKKAAKWAIKSSYGPGWFLDICSGTGQTAANLSRGLPSPNRIIAVDFSAQMLKQAVANIHKKNIANISFTLADALQLPFADESFDGVIISFATRNLDALPGHLIQAFREFHRVLKPGGCFFNLETSQPSIKIIRVLFHVFVKLTVRPIGCLLSGSETSYAYLSSSIRSFYTAPGLEKILYEVGFKSVTYRRYLFGAAAIHKACK